MLDEFDLVWYDLDAVVIYHAAAISSKEDVMPGVFLWGLPPGTPQETIDELERVVQKVTSAALGCPEDWTTLYCPPDLSKKGKRNLWVLAGTGVFETKPWVQAEKMAQDLTARLCPAIHQALGLGPDQKVEAFPLPLALHLHSIYPSS